MHLQAVTCAVAAPRPTDWASVIAALQLAAAEADRQGIEAPTYEILDPDPEWVTKWILNSGLTLKRVQRPVGIFVTGWAEKE